MSMQMKIQHEIKGAAAREGLTLTQAIDKWNKTYNKKQTLNNISNKLRNNTIRFNEVQELLDSLGYDITITRRRNTQQGKEE
ncbi:MAG: LLM class flavin-dependent oxidoreductase [Desulfobacterales bacterium]|nr:LLM class flavin-dependent oxidoreductase [Desulfobacterales bacterium]